MFEFFNSYRFKRYFIQFSYLFKSNLKRIALKYQFFKDDYYDFSSSVNPWLRWLSVGLIGIVILSLALPYLLSSYELKEKIVLNINQVILLSFGVLFYLRLFVEHKSIQFLKSHWFEGIAATIALILGFDLIFDNALLIQDTLQEFGIKNPESKVLLIVKLYLISIIQIKVIQVIPRIIATTKNPARLVLSSFFVVIIIGSIALSLPVSTTNNEGLAPIDALFMSASAVCVTGLAVVDISVQLTFFGQLIILLLIQLGGIGIITFATFLALFISERIGVNQRHVLQDIVSESDISAVSLALLRIVLFTVSIEAIGVIVYYFSWAELIPEAGERLYFAVFHAISAFCNAGFSLFSNSFADTSNALSWSVNMNTMFLIIAGGLGFTTIWEIIQGVFLFGKSKVQRRFSLHSTITLRMTIGLIFGGALLIGFLEWNGVFAGYSVSDKILLSLFQSVTTRTAGFNSVDFGALTVGASLIVMVLMGIGGSPASTAGGIKTTTVYILFAAMLANIQGKQRVEIKNRTIPTSVIFKAISSLFLALMILLFSTILISIYEPFSFIDLLFEQVSAFMTVGVSRGITAELSTIGKLIIISSMFFGRVGLLTFALAFAKKETNQNYRYPDEEVMVA